MSIVVQFKPGHLSHGGVQFALIREHACSCGVMFEGPPNSKRCPACRKAFIKKYGKTRQPLMVKIKKASGLKIAERRAGS